MKVVKTLALVVAAVLAVGFVLPFVIPVRTYIPALERQAGERLGEPVSIGNLRFALLPMPSLSIEDIRIGPQQEVRIGAVTVHPDVWTLTGKVKVLRRVEVDGLNADRAVFARLARWRQGGEGPRTLVVRRVEVRNVNLDLGDLRWGPLRAEALLGEGGLIMAEAGPQDRSLILSLVPRGDAYDLDISGRHWTLPTPPALHFDELSGKGSLTAQGLELARLEGKLYGGELGGSGKVSWQDGLRIEGQAQVVDVDIAPVVRLMGQSASVSGRLHAAGHYLLAAREGAQLVDGLRASFRFEVKKGVLYNFDLASAVRSLTKEGTRGGQTSFNELSGTLNLVGRNVQLRDLRVASGLLQANGDVDIAASRKLSGRVRVEMKGTASLVSVPLEVGGTLRDPVLYPNRAALAGAAVGTGLMGPGLGTTVGAKAGEALDRLFK